MSETRPLTKNYLASHAYWALVCDAEPKLKGVEIGELTNYLNGTSKKLRENLRYAVKIIQREIEDINAEEERKAEAEEERLARKREYERKRREAKIVQGVDATERHAQPQNRGEIEAEKEDSPPAPPIEEKGEDKEQERSPGITLSSKPIAGVGEGAHEGEGEGRPAATAKRFTPPTVEEVRAYVAEKGYHIDAESFVAFYASKGWRVGNTPMKDWRMACVTWERKRLADCTDAPETTMEAERLAALSAPIPHYDMH